ncbi:hypothetical protein RE628_11600 [Paenibacillus sp. D2_2]|uniref:hypothetical protein n=1 Tax=Paenibacillus sp. D2_2 TaxID=3073092 RepID=UPI002815423D|nr:hypothetical protein [Paenibacillus sp. D2_2]WMT42869.1 hypothetical protein RE628_11600 [Paenibacillus sp. D2_2]
MGWIGFVFTLIVIFDWMNQRHQRTSLKKRIISLSITITLLIMIELQYALKDKLNLPIILNYIANHSFMSFGSK